MKIKNNESGVAHIAAIAIVVVIAVVGFVGWKVWDNSKYKSDTKSTTGQPKTKQNTDESVSPVTILKIPELNLQIKLDPSVKDATYAKSAVAGNAAAMSRYGLSTKALESLDTSCSASQLAGARIESFTNPNEVNDFYNKTMIELYPKAVKLGDDYFAINTYAQVECGNAQSSSIKDLQAKVKQGFDNSTLEKL